LHLTDLSATYFGDFSEAGVTLEYGHLKNWKWYSLCQHKWELSAW